MESKSFILIDIDAILERVQNYEIVFVGTKKSARTE